MHKLFLFLAPLLLLTGCTLRSQSNDRTKEIAKTPPNEDIMSPTVSPTNDGNTITGADGTNPENTAMQSHDKAVHYTDYHIITYSSGLQVPRSIALIDDKSMFVTQRAGTILKIVDGITQDYFQVPYIRARGEAGLMGITLDPNYTKNHYLYVSAARDNTLQIIRYTDTGQTLQGETILFTIPQLVQYHAGGALAFGPDHKLYFSMGDATQGSQAQNTTSNLGKLLRINPDGTIPDDNPFPGSAIRSYGHRNIQGIDRTAQGLLIASEHGPTAGFDGKAGGDEINSIQKGGNYGRPEISHNDHKEGMIDPLITYTPALAPSGIIVYTGNLFPQRKGKILVAGLGGTRIVVINPQTRIEEETLLQDSYGRLRAITQNTKGEIFISTSNRDGRGVIQAGDDKILTITTQ